MFVQDFYSSQQQPWITKLNNEKSSVSQILGPCNVIDDVPNLRIFK